MFNFFSNMNMKKKLVTISSALLIIPLIILSFISYSKSEEGLNELGKTNLKNSVEMTIEMIATLDQYVNEGEISLEAAQEKVKEAILGEKKVQMGHVLLMKILI